MYQSSIDFVRTPEEYADVHLSWARQDRAFFAAGACHILAYAFLHVHPNEDYQLIYIRPLYDMPGTHMYVTKDNWAFDFNGWSHEDELLEVTRSSWTSMYPGWDFDRVIISDNLETFCEKNNSRAPAFFPESPWERALAYLDQFESTPPRIRI